MDKLKDKKGATSKSPTKPDTATKSPTKPDPATKSPTKPDPATKSPTKDDTSSKSQTKDETSTKSPNKADTPTKSPSKADASTKSSNKTDTATKSLNKTDATSKNLDKEDASKNISNKEDAKATAASTKAVTSLSVSEPETETASKEITSKDSSGKLKKDKSIAEGEVSKETETSHNESTASDVGAKSSETMEESSAELSDVQKSNCSVNNDSEKDEAGTVSKDNSEKEETEAVNEKQDKDDTNKKSKTVNEKKDKNYINKKSKEDADSDKNKKSKEDADKQAEEKSDSQAEEKSDSQEKESETLQNQDKANESSLEKDATIVSQEESSSSSIEKGEKEKTNDETEEHESMEVEESTGESETKKSESEMEDTSNIEKDGVDKNMEASVTESESMETDPIEDTEKDPVGEEALSNDLETSTQEESTMETDDNEKDKEDDTEKEKDTVTEASAVPKKESGAVEDDEIMEVPVVKKPAPIVDLVDDDEEAKNKNDKSCGPSSNDDSQTNDNSDDALFNNVSESHMGDIVENAGDIIGADDMLGLRISSVVGGEDCITGIAMDEENCHEHDAIQDIQIESVMTLQQPSSPQDPSAMDQENEVERGEVTDKVPGESDKTQEDQETEKEKDDTETDKEKTDEAAKDTSEKDKEKDEVKEKDKADEEDKAEENDKSEETASTKEGEEDKSAEAEGGEKNSDDGGGGLKIVSMSTLADKEQEQDKETEVAQESSETPVENTTDTSTSTSGPKIRLSSAVSAVATESDEYFILRSAVMMPNTCEACKKELQCRFRITKRGETEVQGYLCSQDCKTKWCTELPPNKSVGKARLIFEKCCGMCGREMNAQSLAEQYAWETRDFCSSKCVDEHLVSVASNCHQCQKTVDRPFVGKYCVRFGSDIHQFCANSCLDKYKTNIKVCCYCQKNLASSQATKIVSKTSNKEYCSEKCLKRNQRRDIGQANYSEKQKCTVCENSLINKYEFMLNGGMTQLCSDPCLNIYKYANKVKAVPCCLCQRLMNAEDVAHFIFQEGRLLRIMCTDSCLNTYILSARKIKVCASCKVKKYNFDMVSKHREEGKEDQYFCSLNCLDIGEGRSSSSNNSSSNGTANSNNSINSTNQTNNTTAGTEDEPKNCNMCQRIAKAQYHMVMSDNTLRNFCSYDCATKYKGTYGYMVSGASKSVTSSTSTTTTAGKASDPSKNNLSSAEQMKTIHELQSLLNPPVMVNKMTWCRPQQVTKGVYCKPHPWHKSTQTDPEDDRPPPIIPVPLPIYVPTPMMMYNAPMPVPIFIPLPVPVPIFIPTTAKTTQGIKETLEQLKDELPDDPFEAEMLLLAKRTAEEAEAATPKEDTEHAAPGKTGNESTSSGYNMNSNNSGANVQPHQETNDQDAYSALSHLESCLEASIDDNGEDEMDETDVASLNLLEEELPRFHFRDGSGKRSRGGGGGGRGRKRRRVGSDDEDPDDPDYGHDNQNDVYDDQDYYEKDQEQYEGPFLNSNYGLAAWKHWVQRKNSELSRLSSASRPMKLFKEDLLSLNCDELNNALCIFLKDIRKPSGEEFQGDTVFYLLLGIQQYLFACSRTDCIFMDFGFERFTTGLDDICKRFLEEMAADSLAGNFNIDGTRITEDMLWESRQLGAHTPQVLLNTLFYFNTKVFRLKTVEEHVAISFVQIVKQWKRANVGREGQVQRMTLLRYFPKKSANTEDTKESKPPDWQGYYMYENKEDPLRCPVKLYEFYLSKCPESVRNTRNIYYVYPERSCVPDSPVWFSTQPLHPETLSKMLNRALMVREVQESHSQP